MVVLSEKVLDYPFEVSKIRKLRAGNRVLVNGTIFTGRDRVHKYLADGGECPVDLNDGCIFHCGPIAVHKDGGWVVTSAGPTTSARQDPYMAHVISEFGVRLIIGKGGMGDATRKACAEHGCVYLQAIGGAGALLAERITEVKGVHFLKEFGTADALWELVAERLPAVVAIDSNGRSIYDSVKESSRTALDGLFKRRVRLD